MGRPGRAPQEDEAIFIDATRAKSRVIVLGGLGGDSHSVGLHIMQHALTSQGYRVVFLGTQNKLEAFFEHQAFADAVLVSCMDGHARHYLRDFTELSKRFGGLSAFWYLGGRPSVTDRAADERRFVEMGFRRVFTEFVDIESVIELLQRDLHALEPRVGQLALVREERTPLARPTHALQDDSLEQDTFERERREVLEHWKTGRQARDLDENARFLAAQPSYPAVQAAVNEGRRTILVQPRSGVASVDQQIELFETFKQVGAPVLSYQVDSLTRNNDYAGAEYAIRQSLKEGQSILNGFPVVNHGVEAIRRVISRTKVPLQTRHSTRDPRLLAEISYAGGVTAYEGGAITYNIPYYRDYPLDEAIRTWQYVDRLTGLYHERYGISLDREYFGTLTATLIPPSLAIATCLLEAILATQQGVKCVTLGYAEQGHRLQDIAAIITMREVAEATLERLGFHDVQVNTVFHQYMAAFPQEAVRAEELIRESAFTARLSGATRLLTKTPVESTRIPSLMDNLHGLSLVMRGIQEAEGWQVDDPELELECAIIRREVESIIEEVVFSGEGSVAAGIVRAFRDGIVDVPFSPSIYNRGEVMTARDTSGAVRFLRTGRLPFDRELQRFHGERMSERRRVEGLRSERDDYLLVERDVMRIARGDYGRWPLGAARLVERRASSDCSLSA